MPIRHAYDGVRGKLKQPPLDYQILLNDGTSISLPKADFASWQQVQIGDRVLVDWHDRDRRDTVDVTVFRDGKPLVSFNASKEYVGGGRS